MEEKDQCNIVACNEMEKFMAMDDINRGLEGLYCPADPTAGLRHSMYPDGLGGKQTGGAEELEAPFQYIRRSIRKRFQ
jgi:hypothetical protein